MGSQSERLNRMHWAVVGCCLAALVALGATKAVVNDEVGDHYHCPTADGEYMDPKNCHRFYKCVNWDPIHETCPEGSDYNPWSNTCISPDTGFMCKVYIHPENHHIRHTYYITSCSGKWAPFCTAIQANDTCTNVGLDLVAIENWDEDTFLKDFTLEFEDLFQRFLIPTGLILQQDCFLHFQPERWVH